MVIMLPRFSTQLLRRFITRASPKQSTTAIAGYTLHQMSARNCTSIKSHSFVEIMLVIPVAWDVEPTPALFLVRWGFREHCMTVMRSHRIHVIQRVLVTIVRSFHSIVVIPMIWFKVNGRTIFHMIFHYQRLRICGTSSCGKRLHGPNLGDALQ